MAAGLLSRRQLSGGAVVRVTQGVYRPVWVRDSHVLRCEGVGLALRGQVCALTGRSAASVQGVELAGTTDPVELLAPHGSRISRSRGVLVRRVLAFPADTTPWATTALAGPERMALDLTRGVPRALGVAHLDAVCRAGLVDPQRLSGWLGQQHGAGVVQARRVAALVDPRAESLQESVVRVVLVEAGIEVEPQFVVRRLGSFVARVDLAVVRARVAVEYDGQWHALREQLAADRRRMATLREAGWTVVHVTASDLPRPDEIVARVRRAIADSPANREHDAR